MSIGSVVKHVIILLVVFMLLSHEISLSLVQLLGSGEVVLDSKLVGFVSGDVKIFLDNSNVTAEGSLRTSDALKHLDLEACSGYHCLKT